MNNTLEILKERGFFKQCTDETRLSELLESGAVTFYVGCDPTGISLHIGHMVPFFAFRHLKAAGQKGLALLGGGTARIGDPSGKTESRRILDYEQLDANASAISAQLDRFLGFDGEGAQAVNNKDWLAELNYIDFLREIGSHFSVNRMLSFEAYKQRLETGLSFLEFNYQLLQSYDFLQLFRRYNCRLQIGGDDQWGNIVAGADLIRRIERDEDVFGLTFPLITTADGKKMGKTEQGAIFLDKNLTSVFDFFQYWRNIQDADLLKFLLLFTFLPISECEKLCVPGANPNAGKERLAWEVTSLIHGEDEANKALAGAKAGFGGGTNKEDLPTVSLSKAKFADGYNIVDLFFDVGLCPTKSEARRLVQQGGAFIDTGRGFVAQVDIAASVDFDSELVLRAGKKRVCRVLII